MVSLTTETRYEYQAISCWVCVDGYRFYCEHNYVPVGKVNMELQVDATITVLIDLQDQLNMFRANFCPSSGAQD
jgi:hypothetical protein